MRTGEEEQRGGGAVNVVFQAGGREVLEAGGVMCKDTRARREVS